MFSYNNNGLFGEVTPLVITPSDTGKTFLVGGSCIISINTDNFDEHSRIRFVKQDDTVVTINTMYKIDGWEAPQAMKDYNSENQPNPTISDLTLSEYPQFVELMFSTVIGYNEEVSGIWYVVDRSYTLPKKEITPYLEYEVEKSYTINWNDPTQPQNLSQDFIVNKLLHLSGYQDEELVNAQALVNHPAGQITYETSNYGIGYDDTYSNFNYVPRDSGLYMFQFNISLRGQDNSIIMPKTQMSVSIGTYGGERLSQFIAEKIDANSTNLTRTISLTCFLEESSINTIAISVLDGKTVNVIAGSSLKVIKISDWIPHVGT